MAQNPLETPLMKQYAELKALHPGALLFFRLGDFYELFGDDAVIGSRILEITLTSRDSVIPMAGVPARHYRSYLKILVEAGWRVAIAEQMEEPRGGKTLVRREVVEVITPGAEIMDALEAPSKARRLIGVWAEGQEIGLASVDVSLGEIRVDVVNKSEIISALARLDGAEVIGVSDGGIKEWLAEANCKAMLTKRPVESFASESLAKLPFICPAMPELAAKALGGMVSYISEMIPDALRGLERVVLGREYPTCELDVRSLRTLDIVCAANGDLAAPCLRKDLDLTMTAPGSRLLREWLIAPALDAGVIKTRHDSVENLIQNKAELNIIRKGLQEVRDLERLAVRAQTGRITPREMGALGASLGHLGALAKTVQALPGRLGQLGQAWSGLETLAEKIQETMVLRPPIALGEEPAIREKVSEELDLARERSVGSAERMTLLQTEERSLTGIGNLKIGHSRGVGYYIEVSKANLSKVPKTYRQKQTMTNAVRYTTDKIVTEEAAINAAGEEIRKLEALLFDRLRTACLTWVPAIRSAARSVAEVDCLGAFAAGAEEHRYVRPQILDKPGIQLVGLRHPLTERLVPPGTFIPNDIIFTTKKSFLLLTGPNMGGKSTVLKSVAVAQIMAQAGSFVAAEQAYLSLADRIMSRIGAGDDLARGLSTFMVEMQETAVILEKATPQSLVILDELGRGTSTADGLAMAWAVMEELVTRRCHTLFATHFHELIELADKLPRTLNCSMEVTEVLGQLVFLHKMQEGGSDRSYGLHVALLAGVSKDVIDRAQQIQSQWDKRPLISGLAPVSAPEVPDKLATEIGELDLDNMTPVEALIWLKETQDKLKA